VEILIVQGFSWSGSGAVQANREIQGRVPIVVFYFGKGPGPVLIERGFVGGRPKRDTLEGQCEAANVGVFDRCNGDGEAVLECFENGLILSRCVGFQDEIK